MNEAFISGLIVGLGVGAILTIIFVVMLTWIINNERGA